MSLHQRYTDEIRRHLNYMATWFPTVRLEAGDVCAVRNNELIRVGHLSEFDIGFEMQDAAVKSDILYTSQGAVSIALKAEGQPPPAGSMLQLNETGIAVSFSRANAIAMVLASCSSKRIANLNAVGRQVLELHNYGKWPDDYAVVTEAVEAGASTILISNDDAAGIDLLAGGQLGPGELTLASIEANLSVKHELKIGAKFVSESGLTPLARVSGVKKRILGPDKFRGEQIDELAFKSVDYADFDGYPA